MIILGELNFIASENFSLKGIKIWFSKNWKPKFGLVWRKLEIINEIDLIENWSVSSHLFSSVFSLISLLFSSSFFSCFL